MLFTLAQKLTVHLGYFLQKSCISAKDHQFHNHRFQKCFVLFCNRATTGHTATVPHLVILQPSHNCSHCNLATSGHTATQPHLVTLQPSHNWSHCNSATSGHTATVPPLVTLQPYHNWSHCQRATSGHTATVS